MKNYVIAKHTPMEDNEDRCSYLVKIEGSYYVGAVDKAMRFDYDEVLDFMKEYQDFGYCGFAIVRIEDCTFERLNDRENNQILYARFHEWSYIK